MPTTPSAVRKALVTGALVLGATAGAAGVATAATSGSSSGSSSSTSSSSSSAPSGTSTPAPPGPGAAPDPAAMTHGPNETLLTGTDQQKADAVATAAEPGATIVRAETDSSGKGTYEVHMKKADGTYVTVYLDANFKVTSTGSGFGAGPAGQPGPTGNPPSASNQQPSGATSSVGA